MRPWILNLTRSVGAGQWMRYALVWWLMFGVIEIGQAIAPGYSWPDAIGGILSEAIYFPLSAFFAHRLLGRVDTETD